MAWQPSAALLDDLLVAAVVSDSDGVIRYANAAAAVDAGIDALDAATGGIGGCPFAPRATGNIATEDLLYLLHGMGIETGVSLPAVIDNALWLQAKLGGEPIPGQLSRAGAWPTA